MLILIAPRTSAAANILSLAVTSDCAGNTLIGTVSGSELIRLGSRVLKRSSNSRHLICLNRLFPPAYPGKTLQRGIRLSGASQELMDPLPWRRASSLSSRADHVNRLAGNRVGPMLDPTCIDAWLSSSGLEP